MEIKQGRNVFRDTQDKIHKDKEGNIACCGKPMKMVGHMDGLKFFVTTYECECGNVISINTERNKEDMWW